MRISEVSEVTSSGPGLESAINGIMTVAIFVGTMIGVIMVLYSIFSRRYSFTIFGLAAIIFPLGMRFIASAFAPASSSGESSKTVKGSNSANPPASDSTTSSVPSTHSSTAIDNTTPSSSHTDIDPTTVLIVVSVLVGVIILIVVALFSVNKILKSRKEYHSLQGRLSKILSKAEKIHNKVLQEYFKMESDPWAPIRMPEFYLTTIDENSQVSKFLKSFQTCNFLKIEKTKRLYESEVKEYAENVGILETNWKAASTYAKNIGANRMSPEVRKDIAKTILLLNQAEGSSNYSESSAFLKKAKTIVDKIVATGEIRVDKFRMEKIEASTKLELLQAKTSDDLDLASTSNGILNSFQEFLKTEQEKVLK